MPYITSKAMLLQAQASGYAIGAFNIENMEMAQAVIAAAEDTKAPVIIQTTPGTLKYAPPAAFAGVVRSLADRATVPIALHLDHGNSFELAQQCMHAGYTSLMIDGSLHPYEQNVSLTRSVVEMAGEIPVEAELGTVGGKEDGHEAQAQYTDPLQAALFARDTGITSFAVAIGTAHGVYKGQPKLDLNRLEAIRAVVQVPLVLHGTSGVPEDQVLACIRRGICKVNYATELRQVFTAAVREALLHASDTFDPKQYLSVGREAVRTRVAQLVRLCGSEGKA